jgi:hypothetical protein
MLYMLVRLCEFIIDGVDDAIPRSGWISKDFDGTAEQEDIYRGWPYELESLEFYFATTGPHHESMNMVSILGHHVTREQALSKVPGRR